MSAATNIRGGLSLAWKSIGKSLPLRALILDVNALRRIEGEPAVQGPSRSALSAAALGSRSTLANRPGGVASVKSMLQSEIRAELIQRGESPVGQRPEVEERLEALRQADPAHSAAEAPPPSAAPPPSTAPPPCSAPTPTGAAPNSKPAISPLADLRGKYAGKLQGRVGTSVISDGAVRAATAGSQHLASQKLEDRALRPREEGDGGWTLQPGARELLTYLDMRGMARVLLSSDAASTPPAAEAMAASLVRALQCAPFVAAVPPTAPEPGDEEASAEAVGRALLDTCDALQLRPRAVMLVSDRPAAVRAAKAAGLLSCYVFKRIAGRPQRVAGASHHASDIEGIKASVEDLNGVTFRTPDLEVKMDYGMSNEWRE